MNFKALTSMAFMALAITACKKDEEVAPTNNGGTGTPTTASVKLSYSFVNGATAFDPDTSVIHSAGRTVRITKLKFYAHDFHLTDDADVTVGEFHDKIVLVDALNGSNQFDLGTMAPEHVHNVELAFGLDSASSYGYPDQVAAPAPLNESDMTWAWSTSAGRIFIKLEGTMNDGSGDVPFQYHAIGAALDPLMGHYHIHQEVTAGSTFTIGLKLDLSTLVSNLALDNMYHNDGAQTQLLLANLVAATTPL
ncbi:MAG: hypothetical protein H6590_04125 [Flavobacteriales bacterium]|nr:hypothetical protein [Flavobacteriales bacterium]MCB9178593.1 hypothetical protein [Flavobacteriales bacterium]HPF90618.1 hypothetical protein [Flavobacteriales bacterium]